MHACIHIYIHTQTQSSLEEHDEDFLPLYYASAYAGRDVNICAYMYTYIHTYIHACIHTYIHTQTQSSLEEQDEDFLPLYYASAYAGRDVINLLLSRGADIHTGIKDSNTVSIWKLFRWKKSLVLASRTPL